MTLATGKIWAISALAALGLAYGAWLFADSFLAPRGCCGATWPAPNPMQATRLLEHEDPQERDPARQKAAALDIIRAEPGDVDGWLRLAYADRLRHGRLTPEGRHALDMSYSIAPFAGPRGVWRVIFVLDNWTTAPLRVKQDALAEIRMMKKDSTHAYMLAVQSQGVTDPNGRATAALLGVLAVPGAPLPQAAPSDVGPVEH